MAYIGQGSTGCKDVFEHIGLLIFRQCLICMKKEVVNRGAKIEMSKPSIEGDEMRSIYPSLQPTRESGERRELPHHRLGQSPGRKQVLLHF